MEDGGMSKVHITLALGCVSLIVPCVPCVGSMLYMVALVGTMVTGVMAHTEAKETGENTTLAKVGMGLSLLPIVALVLFIVAYIAIAVFAVIASNM